MSESIIKALDSTKDEEFVEYPSKPISNAEKYRKAIVDKPPIEYNKLLDSLDIVKSDAPSETIQNTIINLMQILEVCEFSGYMYEGLMYDIFAIIKHICSTNTVNDHFLALVKTWFHEYIVSKKYTSLIAIYDTLFTDNLYCDENIKHMYIPEPSDEWIKEKIKEHKEQIENANIRRNAKKPAPKYEKNEIVGAKDKEGRWWMSKILNLFEYQGCVVYFVEFIGWGEKFNEFIADGFRLNRYNPKKHRYFRPAWKVQSE